ncbi:MAG: adenosylmethionine decarboxylase [Desulfobacterales bacterium]|nr:adenosylmethionine decarboxylase [Desulfobacterales bacterium]
MKKDPALIPKASGPSTDATRHGRWPKHNHISTADEPQDHFVERDGVRFAGVHLILDFWGGRHLGDLAHVEAALRECVERCRATLLHIHLHHFSPNGGISGVAVLAESHISVHTWPERGFAAFDVFMCGQARAEEAVSVLLRAFAPQNVQITENLRGISGHARVR